MHPWHCTERNRWGEQVRFTWNLVQSAICLDEAREDVSAAGQAIGNPTKNTGRNANGKDCYHLVPCATQHDLLCLERDNCCQEARNTTQCPEVAAHLSVY